MAANLGKVEKWVQIISTSQDVVESVFEGKPALDIATDKACDFVTDFGLGLAMVAVLPARLISPVALLCSLLSPKQMGNGSLPQDLSDVFSARGTKLPLIRKPLSVLDNLVTKPTLQILKPVENLVEPVTQPVVQNVVKPVVQNVVKPVTKPVVQNVVKPVTQPVVQNVVKPVVQAVSHPVKRFGKHVRKLKF